MCLQVILSSCLQPAERLFCDVYELCGCGLSFHITPLYHRGHGRRFSGEFTEDMKLHIDGSWAKDSQRIYVQGFSGFLQLTPSEISPRLQSHHKNQPNKPSLYMDCIGTLHWYFAFPGRRLCPNIFIFISNLVKLGTSNKVNCDFRRN